MKRLKVKGLMSACLLVVLIAFRGPFIAYSEERDRQFLVPPLSGETVSPTPEDIKVVPVQPGDEIPDWVARWELARVLSYVQRYDEAINEYQKVLREKPDLTEAKLEMAKVLFWKGDQEVALRILEEVSPKAITGDTKVLMADLFAAQNEYAKAEPLYQDYLKHHPQDQAVRLKLAEMLSWQKKYDASLSEYRKILDARPDDTQVRRRYAFVLIWAGKHSEAASELRKTLD
ncbi:MAG: tetratricopeptide repeat protein [Thermodesulfobacteriota bacterium]